MIPQWGEPSSQILVGCPCMDTTRKAKFPYKHKSTETFPSPTRRSLGGGYAATRWL